MNCLRSSGTGKEAGAIPATDLASFLVPAAFAASPQQLERRWSHEDSLAYTRWLATHHYENFHVVSFLLPKRLHQDFYNVYAFCRWADDLGDEIGDTRESLRLLAVEKRTPHDVSKVRRRTPSSSRSRIRGARHQLPIEPFDDLINCV